jgi:hypothetical protein
MSANEFRRSHEHAARAAARVVDPAAIGLDHLDQQFDDARRGVELAALFAFGAGELVQKILVNVAENVARAARRVADLDIADHIDQLAEPRLVERRASVVLRQYAF